MILRIGALDGALDVSAGQDAFGLQHEQALTGRHPRRLGHRPHSVAAAPGRRRERQLDEAGSITE
jgi:hypothetical protein